MGPCEGHETIENYQKQVDAIREILKFQRKHEGF
jgi:excinuclease ABC subunit C